MGENKRFMGEYPAFKGGKYGFKGENTPFKGERHNLRAKSGRYGRFSYGMGENMALWVSFRGYGRIP